MSQPNPTQTFLQEAQDLLESIEGIVLEVQPGAPAGEAVNHLFRAFHTIKGSGAMFGFDAVAAFTHHVETVLDKVRDGQVPVSAALVDLILASKDEIKALLEAAQGGQTPVTANSSRIIAALNSLLPATRPSETCPTLCPAAAAAAAAPGRGAGATLRQFEIRFRPHAGIMATGTNPLMILDELRGLGRCEIVARPEAVPALDELRPDQCYFAWDIALATDREVNAIKDVFIFVEDLSEISISEGPSGVAVGAGAQSVPCASREPGELAPSTGVEQPGGGEAAAAASPRGGSSPRAAVSKDSTVRVPSERLDRLVMLVGEMVMNQSRLTQAAATVNAPLLMAPVEELERLVTELRDNVLGIRMMPIGTTFSRFKRLVHDLSAELGKEIDLVTEGGETEIDKTVLDQLGDPLVHLIRNCIDHGIETGDDRALNGKARRGTIRLSAAHTGPNVIVTIQDDGRGLDAEVIRAKAIEKRLISREATLSQQEIFNLVFLPGFSTARKVTSVSGRGVGMDVVQRQVDLLRGSIQLSSATGAGTSVSLTLPLTLAIIDGLLVEVHRDRFIIPMSAVAENVEITRAERMRNNGRNLIAVRGDQIPYIRLRDDFGIDEAELDTEKIVIVRHGEERVGLVVDRVLGSHQTVIQSLGRFYRDIDVVSGATIMGDGRVALILDVAGVIRLADELAGQQGATASLRLPEACLAVA